MAKEATIPEQTKEEYFPKSHYNALVKNIENKIRKEIEEEYKKKYTRIDVESDEFLPTVTALNANHIYIRKGELADHVLIWTIQNGQRRYIRIDIKDLKKREADLTRFYTLAGEKVPRLDGWKRHKDCNWVDLVKMVPGKVGKFIDGDGNIVFSTYQEFPHNTESITEEIEEFVSLFIEFLYYIMSDGYEDRYDYLVNWMAWMLQNPEQRTERVMVFLGEQGAGKSLFGRYLSTLMSPQATTITTLKYIENSNGILEDTILINFDDVGIIHNEFISTFNSWVTSFDINIKRLYVNPYNAINYTNYYLSAETNEQLKKFGTDARRFVKFPINPIYAENRAHPNRARLFGRLTNVIESYQRYGDNTELIGAIYHYFKNVVKPQKPLLLPKPASLKGLLIDLKSFDLIDQFYYNLLAKGYVPRNWCSNSNSDWEEDTIEVRRESYIEAFRRDFGTQSVNPSNSITRRIHEYQPFTDRQQKAYFPDIMDKDSYYTFENLAKSRESFAKRHNRAVWELFED